MTSPEPRRLDHDAPPTDAIIGRAFRVSIVVLVLVAGLVGVLSYLYRRPAPEESPREASPTLPRDPVVTEALPEIPFTEITAAAGISFKHENGARGEKLLPETMGSGCAFFDPDGDGDSDLFLVNSMPWPHTQEATAKIAPACALYRNDGKGQFADATHEAGLALTLCGMGVATGDYDGDGHVDIFVTAVGENRLLRNVGGTFEDVSEAAGVSGSRDAWSTSAGFFDADLDGDLDLFVCNYVAWSRKIDAEVDFRLAGVGRAYGPPNDFAGTQSYFYRNLGNGTFREDALAAGMHVINDATGTPMGKALALLALDVNRDGWMDLFVANDTVRNFLFVGRGDGNFEEKGSELGLAYDQNGLATGAMGADGAYYRNDGSLGIAVANFATEMSSFYVAPENVGLFTDEAIAEGVGPASRRVLSFGLFFFDADLDGRLDFFQTNGHLEEEIHKVQASQQYRQPSQLFWNQGPDKPSAFVPMPETGCGDLTRAVVGRAAAYADIDADGDLDIVLTQSGDHPLLLRNDQALGHHWLRLKLVGRGGNRDAIGAWVEVETAGVRQRQQVMPTRSYLAQVELELTFGLGEHEQVDAVRVFWPGKQEAQGLGTLEVDRRHVITQP